MSGNGQHFVRNVLFAPAGSLWDEQPSLRELYEQACAGLLRAECEVEELRATIALLEGERDLLRVQVQAGEGLGMALVKTIDELKAEVAGYRYEACRESCRDKEAADRIGGNAWSNI